MEVEGGFNMLSVSNALILTGETKSTLSNNVFAPHGHMMQLAKWDNVDRQRAPLTFIRTMLHKNILTGNLCLIHFCKRGEKNVVIFETNETKTLDHGNWVIHPLGLSVTFHYKGCDQAAWEHTFVKAEQLKMNPFSDKVVGFVGVNCTEHLIVLNNHHGDDNDQHQ
jgi:hypothetical protein